MNLNEDHQLNTCLMRPNFLLSAIPPAEQAEFPKRPTTVKLVWKDQPKCHKRVVSLDMWSLQKGFTCTHSNANKFSGPENSDFYRLAVHRGGLSIAVGMYSTAKSSRLKQVQSTIKSALMTTERSPALRDHNQLTQSIVFSV